jgi:hypothetical protein
LTGCWSYNYHGLPVVNHKGQANLNNIQTHDIIQAQTAKRPKFKNWPHCHKHPAFYLAMAPPWADTPFPMSPTPRTTHPTLKPGVLHIANEMAVCHNALIRIMNSIYNQAPYIELEEDKADFLEYNRRWINWVRVHHHGEETFFFPAIGKATGQPDIMETNVEQHHTFEPLFSQYVDYVEACVLARTYDAVELRRLIDALAPPFTQHLEEEVVTLLELNKFDDEPLRKALEDWEVVLQNLPGAKVR